MWAKTPNLPVSGRDTGLGPDRGQSHGLKGKSSQQMTLREFGRRGVFDESQVLLGLGSDHKAPQARRSVRKLLGNPKTAETEQFWKPNRETETKTDNHPT